MIKTKIKKALASLGLTAMIATSFGSAFAASTIGTATVTWNATFDTNIIWNGTFPGSASGSVNGIKVKARVLPTISMVISTWAIDLWNINAWIEASGSLSIEIGTNSANGVTVTARSWSGGLTNVSNNAVQINNLNTDWIVESYNFKSTVWTHDSTITWFIQSSNMAVTEVNNNTTEHVLYSTNKPEQTDWANVDVVFNVATTTNAQTMAWDYEDNITLTITGNF